MVQHHLSVRVLLQRLVPHLKGHALLFETRPPPTFDSSTGFRLLLIVLFHEVIVGPRLSLLRWFQLPTPPSWFSIPVLLAIALLLVRFFARLQLSQIGLYPWAAWSRIEKSYFIQVFLIANVIFSFLFAGRLQMIFANPSIWGSAWVAMFTYFIWGFYQEVIYRGILQTELIRRWGPLTGILVSNFLYTFGPLHFYHFAGATPLQSLLTFTGIFAIGLFFAVLFRRSGNLGMVGIFHGLGDCYITGLATLMS